MFHGYHVLQGCAELLLEKAVDKAFHAILLFQHLGSVVLEIFVGNIVQAVAHKLIAGGVEGFGFDFLVVVLDFVLSRELLRNQVPLERL